MSEASEWLRKKGEKTPVGAERKRRDDRLSEIMASMPTPSKTQRANPDDVDAEGTTRRDD